MDVQRVLSPGGISAWLVEDYSEPMFSLRFAFPGGSVQDPAGREGLTNFLSLLLSQGAGDLTETEFALAIADLAMKLKFTPDRDALEGSIQALSETRHEVADLIRLALIRPRFETETVERVRRRLLSFHGREVRHPHVVAEHQWALAAFAGHPYARTVVGTPESISAITLEDVKAHHRRLFAKDNLKIVAVGDITPEELGELLDRLFGELPAKAELIDVPSPQPVLGGRLRVAEMSIPQSVVMFGSGAVPFDSPDLMPAYVLSHILGGSAMTSKLGREVRGKRGLAHEASAWLEPRGRVAVLRGRIATRNEAVAESLEVMLAVIKSLADGEISPAELEAAKHFLLRRPQLLLGSQSAMAGHLLREATVGFGPEGFEARKGIIAAVTLDDIKRVAKYLLDPETLTIAIAGSPALQPAPAASR